MTLFIHVTWDGTEPPIRHTVSVEGAGEVEGADEAEVVGDVDVAADVLLLLEALELQPVIASAAAATPATAPRAADLFLSPTAGTPSARVNVSVKLDCDLAKKLTGNFPIR